MGSWKSQEGRGLTGALPFLPCPACDACAWPTPFFEVWNIKLFDLEELSVRMQMSLKNRAKPLRKYQKEPWKGEVNMEEERLSYKVSGGRRKMSPPSYLFLFPAYLSFHARPPPTRNHGLPPGKQALFPDVFLQEQRRGCRS